MAESSNPQQTSPQQQQDQQESPGTPIPFDPALQVNFSPDEINIKPNNEVALLYPDHNNKDYFKIVFDFISKCCLRNAFTKTPTQYKEYLVEFWYTAKVLPKTNKVWFSTPTWGIKGEVGVNSFKNAIGANYLAHSSEYDEPPTQELVKQWFPTIGYNGLIEATRTLKKSFLPPRRRLLMAQISQCLGGKTGRYDQISNKDAMILYCLANRHKMEGYGTDEVNFNPTQIFSIHNWGLKKNQPEGPPFTDHMLAICNADKPMEFKAPKTTFKTEKKDPKGKKPGAKSGHGKQLLVSKNHPQSKIESAKSVSLSKEATESQAGHSKKRKKSGTAKDTNPSQPLVSTPVVTEMHKEVQQATSGPSYLGVTGELRADPQLSSMKSTSHQELVFLASITVHSESALGHDASTDSTTEVDLVKSAPKDLLSQQEGKTQSAGDGLRTVQTGVETEKDANNEPEFDTSPEFISSDDVTGEIKLEDLSKLVKDVNIDTMELDSPKDDLWFKMMRKKKSMLNQQMKLKILQFQLLHFLNPSRFRN
ncbi:hypothetical protein Tco_1017438 [Tanacetum coccineum]|uniref:DUF1985 domain-containing protein n=1 Tax=Tanacetum coccineum TaxID=301880 RepID=A0ABQ5FSV6_9ASTR